MSGVITGYKRSLTITIEKKIDGIVDNNWTLTYYGQNNFTWPEITGTTYNKITNFEMSTMPEEEYLGRLEAFKAYVTNDLYMNYGISIIFDNIVNPDYPAYEEDSVECSPYPTEDQDTCQTCGLELLPYTAPA